jgi:carotenoid cleavage dioxygenase
MSRYLTGLYAPVDEERAGTLDVVAGAVPDDLAGVFVRNASNPRFEPEGRYHWFDGDGMVHAVRFADGSARFANRWVRTRDFDAETDAGRGLWTGIMEPPDPARGFKDTANTDLVWFRGELLALWWLGGDPYRVRLPDLETCGIEDFGGTLRHKMAAHPKVDPATGELVFIDYGPLPPYLTVSTVSPEGRVTWSREVELAGPRLQHDLALTDDWVVVFDFSFLWATTPGSGPLRFDRDQPSRLGLLSRHDPEAPVRWFETSPCFMYHVVNAWQENGRVELVGCRVADPLAVDPGNPPDDGRPAPTLGLLRLQPELVRWTFDLSAAALKEEVLWDDPAEFPRIDDRRFGQPSRWAYLQRFAPMETLAFDAVVRHDLVTGEVATHRWPEGWYGDETVFCPRPDGTDEDDGYLVTFVRDAATGESEVHVLDAAHLGEDPVCRLRMPDRVPAGYHTSWVPEAELAAQRL